jgi:hypothetical protein
LWKQCVVATVGEQDPLVALRAVDEQDKISLLTFGHQIGRLHTIVKTIPTFRTIAATVIAVITISPPQFLKAQSSGPPVTIQRKSGGVQISWNSGVLQERTNLLTDTWRNVPGTANPFSTMFNDHEHYYRVLVAPVPGNRQWKKWSFGCDDGHENVFRLERDGSPIAGSGNCSNCGNGLPGVPGSCWANPVLLNAVNGSLSYGHSQDEQDYGRTFLYVNQPISFPGAAYGDVLRLWLNDQELTPGTVTFVLRQGWNKVEFTSYNQNQGTAVTISIPVNNVLSMDSNGPGG